MRILTVDDSPTVREMLADTLRSAGYEVLQAADGHEGLTILSKNEIDLIISDVNMMKMGGFEFVSLVRENPDYLGIPILFLTTETSEEFKQIGRDVGASGWLEKPFRPDDLLNVIRRVCP